MSDTLKLAAQVARKVGMVPTWPNVQTIRVAIESEAEFLGAPIETTAEMIVAAARERLRAPVFNCITNWERREISRANLVDRFWFEDARWRYKFVFAEFEAQTRTSGEAA